MLVIHVTHTFLSHTHTHEHTSNIVRNFNNTNFPMPHGNGMESSLLRLLVSTVLKVQHSFMSHAMALADVKWQFFCLVFDSELHNALTRFVHVLELA